VHRHPSAYAQVKGGVKVHVAVAVNDDVNVNVNVDVNALAGGFPLTAGLLR